MDGEKGEEGRILEGREVIPVQLYLRGFTDLNGPTLSKKFRFCVAIEQGQVIEALIHSVFNHGRTLCILSCLRTKNSIKAACFMTGATESPPDRKSWLRPCTIFVFINHTGTDF